MATPKIIYSKGQTTMTADTVKFTAESLREAIASRIEPDEPDTILAALCAYEGKALTTRILAKLPGGEARWRIRKQYGMTNLVSREYDNADTVGYQNAYSILIAHATLNVMIECNAILERNTCYFSARKARNAKRIEAMNDHPLLTRLALTMQTYADAKLRLDAAEAEFDAVTDYDSVFQPDSFYFTKMLGIGGK